MNLHQVLTGAANEGEKCFSVGSIDGNHFTAYAAGCNIVILDSDINRVQILSGTELGYQSEVTCIACCHELGKIAASYENKVYIFEPAPVVRSEGKHSLDYQWSQTGLLMLDGEVLAVAWSYFGQRQIDNLINQSPSTMGGSRRGEPRPSNDPNPHNSSSHNNNNSGQQQPINEWCCTWWTKLANPAMMVKFSTDRLLFATAGKNDRLVKVWYENFKDSSQRAQEFPDQLFPDSINNSGIPMTSFSFVYVAHPRAVTGFSWRRTSKYIHR
ncbi:hypothetical protein HELRODRAFT_157310 [Helobdella robusta]|uniref:HELP domain-containing protein n=1 Tax=Helobdella robusta TaxID=6412 RepID=T1EM93_HELRO|nr:hypothetical protein HELRODRAFT_157310 [Helobdella robusta]ESO00910.1 hypothetical protein HELRODRAFT_157310 [Helobdella robusta]